MTLELVRRYFEDEDTFHGFGSNHPLTHHFKECGGTAYISRAKKDVKEIVFRCNEFGGAHVIRECKDNCPKFALCRQITIVREKEAILESLFPMIAE